jgi:hypothetical protein
VSVQWICAISELSVFVCEISSSREPKKNIETSILKEQQKFESNFIRMDTKFPEEVRVKLAELELELSEGN